MTGLVSRSRFVFRTFAAAALIASVAALPMAVQADVDAPRSNDQMISRVVTLLLNRQHLSGHKVDDEISQRTFDMFVKSLDARKEYFTKADMTEFSAMRDKLDDQIRDGKIDFAYTVFNRFLKRVDERIELIDELLDAKHDFTVDEVMVKDRDELDFPASDEEMRERWRKRVKYEILLQKADEKVADDEAVDKVRQRFRAFGRRMHQMDADDLLEMYLTAMTMSFDPHTTYMSPSSLENFEIQMRLELDGIGAALQETEEGTTKITKIIPGGAADKQGDLQPEDQIIGVAQDEDKEFVDTRGMKLQDVVAMIRGRRGTVVRLKVVSLKNPEPHVIKIVRAKIELKDSEARGEVIEAGKKPDGKPFRVGVIDLPSFYMDMSGARENKPDYKSTTRDVRKLIDGFREEGIDAVALDLRRNGGGSLTESINLTGLFIDHGPVVQVKAPDGEVQHYDDLDRGTAWDGPLVVLTSKMSASASEIFAGAIQDYGRGIIIGDHATHGKGTVQSLLDLKRNLFAELDIPNLGALKLTIQQFYRPNGESTQKRGVLADVELPALTTHLDIGEGDLDYALKFDTVKKAEYEPVGLVTPDVIQRLQTRSQQRLAKSEEFQKVLRTIQRYKEQKNRKVVSLNEEKFLADRTKIDLDEIAGDKDEDEKDEHVIKRDYYLDEAMNITIDYITEYANLLTQAGR